MPSKSLIVKKAEAQAATGILYKYFSKKGAERFLQSLQVYYASVKNFNDPFEFKCEINTQYNVNDWKDFFTRKGEPEEQAKLHARNVMTNISRNTLWKGFSKQLEDIGVFCLSPFNDNILMWSHYSESHTALCVELNITNEHNLRPIKKVEYSNDYKELDLVRKPESLKDVIFHKSKDWEYEQEYRVVRDTAGLLLPLNPNSIRSIILGCKASSAFEKKVRRIVANNPALGHVLIKRAEMDEKKYQIKIR